MATKIDSKIIGFELVKNSLPTEVKVTEEGTVTKPKRESILSGKTYKIKDATNDATLYVTINDDTDGHPFEIFINSKKMEHYQWVVALTRVMSAIFRKETDVEFLIEELTSVFDPRGGFWASGKYYPSIVAAIGDCLKKHLSKIEPDVTVVHTAVANSVAVGSAFCPKCETKSLVKSEGCENCLNCGYSKCA
jgi:ribonucleoside-diphosphate reductase alpha chain